MHHLYANDLAMACYRTGNFADGGVIIFDLLAVDTKGNATQSTTRKVLGVMQRDSTKFAATGGWGFEGFAGGDPNTRAVGANAETACYSCHTQVKDSHYVFSRWQE